MQLLTTGNRIYSNHDKPLVFVDFVAYIKQATGLLPSSSSAFQFSPHTCC